MGYTARRILWIVIAALIGAAVRWAFWAAVPPPQAAYRHRTSWNKLTAKP